MSAPQFVHLRMHSEYSISDGMVRFVDVVNAAKNDVQGAVSLTDLGNLFGAIKFYKMMRQAGIKPILGCDVMVSHYLPSNMTTSITPISARKTLGDVIKGRCLLLIKDVQGYLNLCSLLSRSYLNCDQRGEPELNFSWFSEIAENLAHANELVKRETFTETVEMPEQTLLSAGLIVLSGAHDGAIGQLMLQGKLNLAQQIAQQYKIRFKNDFYFEIQRSASKNNDEYLEAKNSLNFANNEWLLNETINLAKEMSLPVVATHPIQFMRRTDFMAHEARVCIATSEKLSNNKRKKIYNEEQYFKTQAEMLALFSDVPQALSNSVAIAQRCNLVLSLGDVHLPIFPTPHNQSLEQFFIAQARSGLEKRLIELFPDAVERELKTSIYWERLNYEITVINQMGFSGYFLIVSDFVAWAIAHDIPVGPGRGSGAGSLVAFALKITNLDPLQYNLLFERFLNPERVSMPDFDIDFCQHGRDSVIGYVKEKYGQHAVSQIVTFGTMAAKAVIRDVGRVLDLGYNFTDGIARLIPFKPGKHVTIQSALNEEPVLLERYHHEEEVKNLIDLAQQLEGLTRNVGMHAGGVLIADAPLTCYCPVYKQDETTGVVSQYDKDDVEAIGLVKFDFLGLTTLTVLQWTERLIRQNYSQHANWNRNNITLDDQKVFSLLKTGKTIAVFQLESRGMQGLLRDAQPDRFEDIIALVALFRPGPIDLIPSFCARKQGRELISYPDERVAEILSETYGIMVYQEQVMQMAQIIGGYSLGNADLLRRAMGKKKPKEMAKHRSIFCHGAVSKGLTKNKADEIFDLMEKFAGYGFNKSHAASYALLAYYTAWMKVYYPAEFMAANLSLAIDDSDKLKNLLEEVKALGITILPPDINRSAYYFLPDMPEKDGCSHAIRFGLGAIKGTGKQAITYIENKRNDHDFVDIFDFCSRFEGAIVNKRTIESLIKAGAFDSIESNRFGLLESLPFAFEVADYKKSHIGQDSLFSEDEVHFENKICVAEAWSQLVQLREEKTVLGFYLSGHPFDSYAQEVLKLPGVIRIIGLYSGRQVMTAGIISQIRKQATSKGKFVLLTLDDGVSCCEVTISNQLYDKHRSFIKEDDLLIVSGQVRENNFSGGFRLIASELMDLLQMRMKYAKKMRIKIYQCIDVKKLKKLLLAYGIEKVSNMYLHEANLQNSSFQSIARTVEAKKDMRKGLPVEFLYQNDQSKILIEAGITWLTIPSQHLLNQLIKDIKNISVEIIYS